MRKAAPQQPVEESKRKAHMACPLKGSGGKGLAAQSFLKQIIEQGDDPAHANHGDQGAQAYSNQASGCGKANDCSDNNAGNIHKVFCGPQILMNTHGYRLHKTIARICHKTHIYSQSRARTGADDGCRKDCEPHTKTGIREVKPLCKQVQNQKQMMKQM